MGIVARLPSSVTGSLKKIHIPKTNRLKNRDFNLVSNISKSGLFFNVSEML